jgi:hypothetical protein
VTNHFDDFSDIIGTNNGVFGATEAALDSALEKHDSVETAVMPQGAALEFRCPGCGKMRRLIIEYPELVALKYFVSPHQAFVGHASGWCPTPSTWRFVRDEHKFGLVQKCSFCNFHYPVRLDPNEPEKILAMARRNNLFNPQVEAAVAHHCNAIRQRQQQQR